MPVSSSTEHWINPDALTINLNHFGDPDYLQVSLLAGAVVMAFKQDVIGYNAAHNYRTWPLEAANTYLETSSAINVYAKLTRSEVNARALIVYDTVLRDIEGREITYAEDGSEILGEPNLDSYYVFLGQISASVNSNGESVLRKWDIDFRAGNLDTNQYRNEESTGEWSKMFRLNKVTDFIDVLKVFSSAIFKQFSIKKGETEKNITDIKRSSDSDNEFVLDEENNEIKDPSYVSISDDTIPTTKYVKESTEKKFLRKDIDDTAKGNITFEKNIGSHDFVKGNLMGAGWSIYKDANGNTVVETDTIIARKGINASELIVNQETFEKGSNIFVKGGCTIVKVEEIDGKYRCFYDNENGKRFSGFKVGDQARCQRYDSSYGLKIKYYWRLVVGVADDYVELSMTDFDGDGVPEAGDDIAQLGNRTDKTRQSAIVISPDNGGSVVVWAGIDSYNLSERNMCGMGVNPNSGRAYIYGYGDMFFGDRSLEKNFITYQIKDGDTEPTLTINADVHLSKDSTGLGNLTEFEEIKTNVDYLNNQIEREFTIWYFDDEPTLDNEPAVNWTTDELKAMHDQDLYFSDELARAWRFVNGNWVEVTDERTLAALKLADEAQKAATEAKDYINNVLPKQLEGLQNQIDGTIESYFYKYDPSLDNYPANEWVTEEQKEAHLNDTFTNLESGYSWRWAIDESEVYGWIEITDTATVKALAVAGKAQDTADGKRRVFVETPFTPYNIGDLWVQGEAGDIMRCAVERLSGKYAKLDWVKASKYTDDTLAQEALNKAESFSDDLSGVLADMEIVKGQVDREFTIWYYDAEPTLYNEPAINWNTQSLIEMHDQDIYFSDSLARAWRFVKGRWVEITDERTIAALNKVSDLEFIKEAFGENVMQGGVLISDLVGVQNDDEEIEAFLNGGDFAKDDTHGKLILAGGIPEAGGNLEERSRKSATRLYKDGHIVSKSADIEGTIRVGTMVHKTLYGEGGDLTGYSMAVGTQGVMSSFLLPEITNEDFIEVKVVWFGLSRLATTYYVMSKDGRRINYKSGGEFVSTTALNIEGDTFYKFFSVRGEWYVSTEPIYSV